MSGAGVQDEVGGQRGHAREAGYVANDQIRLIVSSSLPADSEGFGSCDTDTVSIEDRDHATGRWRRVLTLGPHTARQLALALERVGARMTDPQRVAAANEAVGREQRMRMGISGRPSDAERPGAVD